MYTQIKIYSAFSDISGDNKDIKIREKRNLFLLVNFMLRQKKRKINN